MIRPFLKDDVPFLKSIVVSTGVFRPEEVDVAVELMEIAVNDPDQKDYDLQTFVDDAGAVRGYYCIGPTPMTAGTFDLYWIAVDPSAQQKGVGTQLMKHIESNVRSKRGRLIVVETSSKTSYAPTRAFYMKHGYIEASRIRSYYAEDDDLVVFAKYL